MSESEDLTARLCLLLDLKPVAAGRRAVWSTRPTATQKPFPKQAEPVLTKVIDYAIEAVRKYGSSLGEDRVSWTRDYIWEIRLDMYRFSNDSWGASLTLRNRKDEVLADYAASIPTPPPGIPIDPEPGVPEFNERAPKVSFSAAARDRLRELAFDGDYDEDSRWKPTLDPLDLDRPDIDEPLAFGGHEVLGAYARWKNRSLVISLANVHWRSSLLPYDESETLEDTHWKLEYRRGCAKVPNSDGIVVYRPIPDLEGESMRYRRSDVARLIQIKKEKGRVPLDDRAWFASRNPSPAQNDESPVLSLLYKRTRAFDFDTRSSPFPWEALRLWATLPTAIRQTPTGTRVPFRSFPPKAQTQIVKMLFDKDVPIVELTPERDALPDWTFDTLSLFKAPEAEPTVLLPQGLPPDTPIEIVSESGVAFKSTNPERRRTSSPI